jgi:hemerythrin
MTQMVREKCDGRWLRSTGTHRQAIIPLAEELQTLESRGGTSEAEQVEHAIQLILKRLWEAVLASAGRVEVIEILNTLIDFSATRFADEEGLMRKSGHADVDAHVAAHRRLWAEIVAARRSATGEGLSLAVLDVADLLNDFQKHVKTWDRAASTQKPKRARKRAAIG